MEAFRRMVNLRRGLKLSKYIPTMLSSRSHPIAPVCPEDIHDLHRYSVEDYNFWLDLWAFLGVIYSVPPQKVPPKLILTSTIHPDPKLTQVITGGRMKEIPTWFPGAKLNIAENLLLRRHDAIAYTSIRETGSITHYTFREVNGMVEEMAAALRISGLRIGDRVAGMTLNVFVNLPLPY